MLPHKACSWTMNLLWMLIIWQYQDQPGSFYSCFPGLSLTFSSKITSPSCSVPVQPRFISLSSTSATHWGPTNKTCSTNSPLCFRTWIVTSTVLSAFVGVAETSSWSANQKWSMSWTNKLKDKHLLCYTCHMHTVVCWPGNVNCRMLWHGLNSILL